MELNDFANRTPWLITADKLEAMFHHIPATADLPAELFSWIPEEDKSYPVKNSVAVVPIVGPMFKRATLFSRYFGDVSMTGIAKAFLSAVADDSVKAIVLNIDSPGGTVSGTEALSDAIYSAKGKKPIVAFANGMMCSAAYWAGSGVDKIVVESTATVGSIGVVMVHVDWSEAENKWGIKRTVLTAGQYKAIGNNAEPLSDKARKVLQDHLDYIYSVFISAVERNRGVSNEQALAMADGRVFIGQQSVDAGLADTVGSLDSAIEMAIQMADKKHKSSGKQEAKTGMDLETLKKDHPVLFAQIQGEVVVKYDATISDLGAQIVALKSDKALLEAEAKDLGKQIVSLESKLSEQGLKAVKEESEKIFDAKLGASKVPEKMHARVKRGVDFNAFYKDGVFASIGFTAAVDAEIKDWEGDVGGESVQGSGGPGREVTDSASDKDEDAMVDSLLKMAGQAK
ncbi:MAG: signal peptide peptidase SppA [Desulfatirhabdiaceae bacterium]